MPAVDLPLQLQSEPAPQPQLLVQQPEPEPELEGHDATSSLRRRLDGGKLSKFDDLPREPGVVTLCYGTDGATGYLTCGYAAKIAWLLEALRLPYCLVDIDISGDASAKPAWFVENTPKAQTPAAWVEGEWLTDSGTIHDKLVELAAASDSAEAQEFAARRMVACADGQLSRVFSAWVQGIFSDPIGDDPDYRKKLEAFQHAIGEAEASLATAGSSFMHGNAPGPSDVEAVPYIQGIPLSEECWPELRLCVSSYPLFCRWVKSVGELPCYACFCHNNPSPPPQEHKRDVLKKLTTMLPDNKHIARLLQNCESNGANEAPAGKQLSSRERPFRAEMTGDGRSPDLPEAILDSIMQDAAAAEEEERCHKSKEHAMQQTTLPNQVDDSSAAYNAASHTRTATPSEPLRSQSFKIDGNDMCARPALPRPAKTNWTRAYEKVVRGYEVRKRMQALTKSGLDFSTTVASSRSSSFLRPSYWYFMLLDTSWIKLIFALLLVYLIAVLVCMACILLTSVDDYTNDTDSEPWRVAFRVALSNVVTCGYPPHHVPQSDADAAFYIATLMQMGGVILQAFLFSVAVTRFQMAKADFFFSDKVCFSKRFGTPYVTIRIGNRRCNLIFHPEVRMVALMPTKTPEGEQFFRIEELPTTTPSTMAGSITVAHKIDQESALAPALSSDGKTVDEDCNFLRTVHICVTIVAADNTFQSEVQGIKRYSATDFAFGSRFADVMRLDNNNEPIVDFERFHELVPLRTNDGDEAASPQTNDGVSASVCF